MSILGPRIFGNSRGGLNVRDVEVALAASEPSISFAHGWGSEGKRSAWSPMLCDSSRGSSRTSYLSKHGIGCYSFEQYHITSWSWYEPRCLGDPETVLRTIGARWEGSPLEWAPISPVISMPPIPPAVQEILALLFPKTCLKLICVKMFGNSLGGGSAHGLHLETSTLNKPSVLSGGPCWPLRPSLGWLWHHRRRPVEGVSRRHVLLKAPTGWGKSTCMVAFLGLLYGSVAVK